MSNGKEISTQLMIPACLLTSAISETVSVPGIISGFNLCQLQFKIFFTPINIK